jgi:Secretion system C-terminal sorting domain
VGVEENDANGFALFPNPTDGHLFIRTESGVSGYVQMDVFDVMGRSVLNERFAAKAEITRSLDFTGLPNGHYAVRLSTDQWSRTQQLEISR